MAAKYTLFLIDDHQSLLDGLKAALSVFPHITIVGMASDYESSIAQISKKTFNADIVVTDHALGSDLDGLDLCRAVKQLRPDRALYC